MDGPSRRDVLRAGGLAGVVAATGLSGCSLMGDGEGTDTPAGGDAPQLDVVPEGATAVVRADLQPMFADEQLRDGVNRLVGDLGETAPSITVGGALDAAQEQSGLDPRRMDELLAFGSEATGEGALVVRTDFTEAEVTDLLERSSDVTERSYGGYTVYASGNGSQLAVLGEGRYALGTQGAVEDVIGVRNGDVPAVDGEVRTAYTAARGGYMRFAFDVPTERLPGSGGPAAAARDIQYGYGSLYRDGDALSLSVSARTGTAEGAEALRAEIETAVAAARDQLDRIQRRQLRTRVERLLDRTELSRSGRTVTVRNPDGGAALATGVAVVVTSFVVGIGPQRPVAPQATFEFEYDTGASELTVTHYGGDSIAADRLTLRGSGLGTTGTWSALGGTTSGDRDGQPTVQAGDSVTVGAQPDYELDLVWTAEDGATSQTLAADSGPG